MGTNYKNRWMEWGRGEIDPMLLHLLLVDFSSSIVPHEDVLSPDNAFALFEPFALEFLGCSIRWFGPVDAHPIVGRIHGIDVEGVHRDDNLGRFVWVQHFIHRLHAESASKGHGNQQSKGQPFL